MIDLGIVLATIAAKIEICVGISTLAALGAPSLGFFCLADPKIIVLFVLLGWFSPSSAAYAPLWLTCYSELALLGLFLRYSTAFLHDS